MRPLVIGGNWKLQINRVGETQEILSDMVSSFSDLDLDNSSQLQVFLALPYTSLHEGHKLLQDTPIKLGAQNVHYEEKGPYTGEISITALAEVGVDYVLIGHSERRIIFGEEDDHLNRKIKKVLEYDLTPVFCVGETAEQRNGGRVKEVLHEQLQKGLAGIDQEQIANLVLAYEPVWAINNPLLNPSGTIQAATPAEAETTHRIIRDWFQSQYGEMAQQVPIQYGGSMKPSNAYDLLHQPNIDGGLIGSASLSADAFMTIVQTAFELQS